MAKCGDCQSYFFGTSMAQGFCKAQPTGANTYKFVMYHADAKQGCNSKLFKKLESVKTDDRGQMYTGESFRRYAEFKHKPDEFTVAPDKTKDERSWG